MKNITNLRKKFCEFPPRGLKFLFVKCSLKSFAVFVNFVFYKRWWSATHLARKRDFLENAARECIRVETPVQDHVAMLSDI